MSAFTAYDHVLDTMMTRTGIHLDETLRFVSSEDGYSVYTTPDGDDVYLQHGTGVRLVTFDDLDIYQEWRKFRYTLRQYDREGFREHLRELIIDPDEVDEQVNFCEDCSMPVHPDESFWTGHETSVCESCYQEYSYCNDCEESFRDTTTTLNDREVCERCRGRNWSYCEECEGYYPDDYASDHEHQDARSGTCCESPAMSFSVRNDGEVPLSNDTRATITLPAGVITGEGISEIRNYLYNRCWEIEDEDERYKMRQLAQKLDSLDHRWQTKEGNFTKRLSRFAYKEFGLKVAPEIISRVGCIARDHSTAVDHQIEVTRDLNLSAEDFCHEDSCWWQSYSSSRCALKTNGGFGLRTFTGNEWESSYPSGRAWVMPLRLNGSGKLGPTFDAQNPDAFVVFNGYGDLEGYAPARILSHMAGMTYRKITFSCDPMYVNNSSGYLIAPEEIASDFTDGSLRLYVSQHADLYYNERELIHA